MLDRVSGAAVEAAISRAVQSASEKSVTVQTESGENSWFSIPAQALLGSDPGFALHILTNKQISESSGYRYVSGERPIPIFQFRQLVHRPDGAPWHGMFMQNCTAPWWLDMQRFAQIGAAVVDITKRG